MKRLLIALICVMTTFGTSLAFAEDSPVKATLGLKFWYNNWTETGKDSAGNSVTNDYGNSLMAGPSLNVRFFDKVFVGATYMTSLSDYSGNDVYNIGDTVDLKRTDIDFTLGYMFTPHIGIFIGSKSLSADEKYTLPPTYNNTDIGTWKLSGPGIGVLGNIPLGRSAALYGNLAYMKMSQSFSEPGGVTVPSFDMDGVSLEFGGAFAFSRAVSANVGLKYQDFWGTDDVGVKWTEEFVGLTFGVNYTF